MRRRARLACGPLLAVAFAGCGPVDPRPPHRTPAYLKGRARIERLAPRLVQEDGPYRAGWARVRIRAPEGAPVAGYRRGDRPHEGERDPLYVRAFAIAVEGGLPVVFLTADLIAAERGYTEVVRDRLEAELPRERLRFSATHTHSGLGGYVARFPFELTTGPFQAETFDAVVEAHVEAAHLALHHMAPARVGHAEASAPGVCKNRVESGARVDEVLSVLHLEHAEGGARAALLSHGCHAVVWRADHHQLSADFPGAIAARLEGRALDVLGFVAGGVGNAEPALPTVEAMAEALIEPLQSALAAARAGARPSGRFMTTQVELPTPRLQVQLLSGLALWSPLSEAVLAPRFSLELTVIDEAALFGLPVELAGHLAAAWREHAARRGLRLVFLGFNGDYLGYVNARETFDLPTERRGPGYHNELVTLSFLGPAGAELVLGWGEALLESAGYR